MLIQEEKNLLAGKLQELEQRVRACLLSASSFSLFHVSCSVVCCFSVFWCDCCCAVVVVVQLLHSGREAEEAAARHASEMRLAELKLQHQKKIEQQLLAEKQQVNDEKARLPACLPACLPAYLDASFSLSLSGAILSSVHSCFLFHFCYLGLAG